ncbi:MULTISPECIES: T9SS type A sorting domain-containing protein [unclassified Lentimicrobium]|uniref:T9SS type A sorting domain-containing protein n=1 Tax=unclassified Lentimicrobium TaxID=2677434 RepID=UPI001556753B|nr:MULTISPECIES: T9SS type A sorting domain-containing protein [unclassified Lentimicrobium]NPD44453.1 T9SS type A sorting domain-containing protein [Lentimicrobium sp. S6]NPD83359.1 T9SS type A sorting domain-containing protein [Lentimicrobium sp. L6]
MRKQLLIILFAIITIGIFSQTVTTYNTDNAGISVDRVSSITEINGDIWIGEGKGISRFDGTTWTNYPWSVMNAPWDWIWIHKIIEDLDGNIWACGEAGLWKFDGTNWAYFGEGTPELSAGFMFMDMVMDEEGVLWILGGNTVESWLYSLVPSTMTFTVFDYINYPELNNDCWKIDINSEGKKILASDDVGFLEFDGISFTTHEAITTFDFDYDEKDNLWSGGYSPVQGLYYYDNEINQLAEFKTSNSLIPFDWIRFMMYNFQADYQSIWFAGEQGFYNYKGVGIYEDDKNLFVHFDETTGLINNYIQAFFFRENEAWMGTYNHGVMKLDYTNSAMISADTSVFWVDIQMGDTQTIPFNINNKGGGNLSYIVNTSNTASWLSTNDNGGTTTGYGSNQHEFTFDASNYNTPGTYETTFDVESNGGKMYIKAIMDVSDITGNKNIKGLDFIAYPNPANDILNVNFKSLPERIRILNATGQSVYIMNNITYTNTLDISNLPVGSYILETISEGKNQHIKFQKL